jgi:hypothetical protein
MREGALETTAYMYVTAYMNVVRSCVLTRLLASASNNTDDCQIDPMATIMLGHKMVNEDFGDEKGKAMRGSVQPGWRFRTRRLQARCKVISGTTCNLCMEHAARNYYEENKKKKKKKKKKKQMQKRWLLLGIQRRQAQQK